jgi:hypothetical protein
VVHLNGAVQDSRLTGSRFLFAMHCTHFGPRSTRSIQCGQHVCFPSVLIHDAHRNASIGHEFNEVVHLRLLVWGHGLQSLTDQFCVAHGVLLVDGKLKRIKNSGFRLFIYIKLAFKNIAKFIILSSKQCFGDISAAFRASNRAQQPFKRIYLSQ